MAAASQLRVVCPAAEPIGETANGPAVRCRVEHSTISAGENPTSLVAYCLGEYTNCPTWRAEKEREWARKRQPLVRPEEAD